MKQINVYKYDELTTENAKEKARQWFIEIEQSCPAWLDEHTESMNKSVELAKSGKSKEEISKVSEDIAITGYCADAFLADLIKELGKIPTAEEIEEKYNLEWNKEMEERLTNVEYIEENIISNEYEFFENGEKYKEMV